ncbi:hypothetical protein [Enterococcus hirae]|uniref:hypothetical protein n=1 Tax=Enterococcus hirae TaxID=1354 RepID=UPI001F6235C6|nr:hypothetical protein [Enterococcus hirae]
MKRTLFYLDRDSYVYYLLEKIKEIDEKRSIEHHLLVEGANRKSIETVSQIKKVDFLPIVKNKTQQEIVNEATQYCQSLLNVFNSAIGKKAITNYLVLHDLSPELIKEIVEGLVFKGTVNKHGFFKKIEKKKQLHKKFNKTLVKYGTNEGIKAIENQLILNELPRSEYNKISATIGEFLFPTWKNSGYSKQITLTAKRCNAFLEDFGETEGLLAVQNYLLLQNTSADRAKDILNEVQLPKTINQKEYKDLLVETLYYNNMGATEVENRLVLQGVDRKFFNRIGEILNINLLPSLKDEPLSNEEKITKAVKYCQSFLNYWYPNKVNGVKSVNNYLMLEDFPPAINIEVIERIKDSMNDEDRKNFHFCLTRYIKYSQFVRELGSEMGRKKFENYFILTYPSLQQLHQMNEYIDQSIFPMIDMTKRGAISTLVDRCNSFLEDLGPKRGFVAIQKYLLLQNTAPKYVDKIFRDLRFPKTINKFYLQKQFEEVYKCQSMLIGSEGTVGKKKCEEYLVLRGMNRTQIDQLSKILNVTLLPSLKMKSSQKLIDEVVQRCEHFEPLATRNYLVLQELPPDVLEEIFTKIPSKVNVVLDNSYLTIKEEVRLVKECQASFNKLGLIEWKKSSENALALRGANQELVTLINNHVNEELFPKAGRLSGQLNRCQSFLKDLGNGKGMKAIVHFLLFTERPLKETLHVIDAFDFSLPVSSDALKVSIIEKYCDHIVQKKDDWLWQRKEIENTLISIGASRRISNRLSDRYEIPLFPPIFDGKLSADEINKGKRDIRKRCDELIKENRSKGGHIHALVNYFFLQKMPVKIAKETIKKLKLETNTKDEVKRVVLANYYTYLGEKKPLAEHLKSAKRYLRTLNCFREQESQIKYDRQFR